VLLLLLKKQKVKAAAGFKLLHALTRSALKSKHT